MAIGTVEFDLSMVSPQSGEFLTARAYTVEGVTNADGSLRQLSIGQLVMAICLSRASKLEADIIALMEEMSTTSAQLADMTKIEQAVIDDFAANQNGHAYDLNNVTVTSSTSAVQLLRDLEVISQSCKWHFGGEEHIIRDLLHTGRTHNCTHSCCPWC